jgi:hypothetical protein
MRSVAWCSLLALLLTVGPAAAQGPVPPMFEIAVTPGMLSVAPGNATEFQVEVIRSCPSGAAVLADQSADMQLNGPADVSLAGPQQVVFQQQVCAQQMQQAVSLAYTVLVPSDFNGSELLDFRVTVRPHQFAGPGLGSPGEEASVGFVANVDRPALDASSAEVQTDDLEAPALPSVLLGFALLACAFALRRR